MEHDDYDRCDVPGRVLCRHGGSRYHQPEELARRLGF
jgi:hypothetical protein